MVTPEFIRHSHFSLLVQAMGMASTIAIITGLCGFRRKRSPELSAAPDLADKSDIQTALKTTQQAAAASATTSTALGTDEKTESSEQVMIKELPPPPGMTTMRALKETHSCNNFMVTKSESTRKLSATLSVKHVKSISVKFREKKRPKDEDSIWKKTIILGEKCKISDDEGDAVIFNGKHDTVLAYHPRTMSTISISRTSSFREPDTTISRTNSLKEADKVPNQDKEKGTTRKGEEDS